MGCDIHLFAEKKVQHPIFFWRVKWRSIDKYTLNEDFGLDESEPKFHINREDRIYTGGRNYNLFCALAGIRSNCFTNDPPIVSEPKGISNHCPEIIDEINRYGSDGHSHSWNTLKELKEFDWSPYGTTCDEFKKQVFPKLEAETRRDEDVRIVYFFDN